MDHNWVHLVENAYYGLDMCAVGRSPKGIKAKMDSGPIIVTALPPTPICNKHPLFQSFPSFFSITTVKKLSTFVCVVVQLTRCMLTDFAARFSVIHFLAVPMPNIYNRVRTSWCSLSLWNTDERTEILLGHVSTRGLHVIAWAPISTLLEAAGLSSWHPDIVSGPYPALTGRPWIYCY